MPASNPFQPFSNIPNSLTITWTVGLLVALMGVEVGLAVGFFETRSVGLVVGTAGLRVGLLLGLFVTLTDGFPDGFLVVGKIGLVVGFVVGRDDGDIGFEVGFIVGLDVDTPDC